MWGVCKMGILGFRGFKKKWQVTFHFCITILGFRTACEIALGVRNFMHGLRKFR